MSSEAHVRHFTTVTDPFQLTLCRLQEPVNKPVSNAVSYEAYAAEVARKHRVMDRSEIMTADAMFDSSAFEEKLDQFDGALNHSLTPIISYLKLSTI